MNRIVHFEIHADDIARASKFYEKVFGWEIKKWDSNEMEYYMVMTAPMDSKDLGINGGMIIRKGDRPKEGQCINAFVCTIDVKDIDKTIKDIVDAGGKLSMPKFKIADMAYQAYYMDTEGNVFGIHQRI